MSTAVVKVERGVTAREEFSGGEVQRNAETAIAAVMAREKAMVEAQFVMAERHPRVWMDVRANMLDHCKRPRFAEIARYSRPAGKEKVNGEWVEKKAEGFSTRFTEMLAQEMGNVKLAAQITYEDDLIRIVRFTALDLQKNVVKDREVTIAKAVERRGFQDKKSGEWEPPKGREVLSVRLNSAGEPTYLVRATDEELRAKTNSEESKTQRDFITRLCPRDILEDCEDIVRDTIAKRIKEDPDAYRKRVLDSFNQDLGVKPSDLEQYSGKPAKQWLQADIVELRELYTAIRDGQTTFDDAMKARYSPPEGEETAAEHDSRLQRQMKQQGEVAERRLEELRGQQAESTGQSNPAPDAASNEQPAQATGEENAPPPNQTTTTAAPQFGQRPTRGFGGRK